MAERTNTETYLALRRDLGRAVRTVCPHWMADHIDDILQAAMLRVHRVCQRDETERELPASYLWKVAHSAVVDEIRRIRRRRETAFDDDTPPDSVVSGRATPEATAGALEVGRAIKDCLRRLIRHRGLAVTLFLQGHTVPEVSRLLGFSAKKAENLVYRGLADLRGCLREKGVEP